MAHSAYQSRIQHFLQLISDIRHSEVFDASFYRSQSLGAKLSIDPVLHYLFVGWKQGLNPSPAFDTKFYIERYRDVKQSQANPLKHYMIHGRNEGRLATRSGRIFRESLLPECAPLPIFGAPSGATPRLSVLIDDHTPQLLGVGYLPLLGLASHTAAQAGWSLRIIVRSTRVSTTEVSSALNAVSDTSRPVVEIVRREPGPTDDVDATDSEIWWASSATAMESLRHLVDPSTLWWVATAVEADRVPAGEHRELIRALLADRATRIIAVGHSVQAALPQSRVAHAISSLPPLLSPVRASKPKKTLGVVVAPEQPESLASTATAAVEYALTHHLLDPRQWSITLLGVDWEPLTISGSVVVQQTAPTTPEEWAVAIGSVNALVVAQAGTEQPWLVDQAVVPAWSGRGVASEIAQALHQVLTSKPVTSTAAQWADVVTPIVGVVEKTRG